MDDDGIIERLANDLEQTKIEMKKKGATFIPNIIGGRGGGGSASKSSEKSKKTKNGGLNALAPSLAKPVSASREMFEKAKETLLVTGKTRMRSCIDDDKRRRIILLIRLASLRRQKSKKKNTCSNTRGENNARLSAGCAW